VLALIMRAIFIALSATLLALFLLFGLLLIYTAVQQFRHGTRIQISRTTS
jgi:tellurite resistance protein TerC